MVSVTCTLWNPWSQLTIAAAALCARLCLQDYCINREQWDFVLDITKCKSKAPWAADPTEGLGSKVKSAFTRKFNQQVRHVSSLVQLLQSDASSISRCGSGAA